MLPTSRVDCRQEEWNKVAKGTKKAKESFFAPTELHAKSWTQD